jgi:hypothetical protein
MMGLMVPSVILQDVSSVTSFIQNSGEGFFVLTNMKEKKNETNFNMLRQMENLKSKQLVEWVGSNVWLSENDTK